MPPDIDEHGFIVGIHNYCDRWCERCPFSSRCRAYAIEMAIAVQGPEKALASAFDLDPEEAGGEAEPAANWEADAGADFAVDEEVEAEMARHEAARLLADVHPLGDAARALIRLSEPLVTAVAGRAGGPGPEATALRDPYEVLARYRYFVPAKLHRALSGRESREPDEPEGDVQSDANGSAKIAHITCASARDAALRLGELEPTLAAPAADFARSAERVLALIDEAFPDHRAFRRPGFDDIAGP